MRFPTRRVFLLLAWLVALSWRRSCHAQKTVIKFEDIVPEDYDKSLPPVENGWPVTVEVKVSVLNIRFVNEEQQSFGVDIFLHHHWTDRRLHVPPSVTSGRLVLDNRWRKDLWTPDTYFKNLLNGKVHDVVIPYTYLVVHNNSDVFSAARVSLDLSCEMDLAAFPHDVQTCTVVIMSLQHTVDSVVLVWKEFEVTSKILMAQYNVIRGQAYNFTKTYSIGSYSCLVGHIKLARRLGYYLINKYIPSVLIVSMSFVTFWIPAEAYPARVTLSVTSLLTIVTQQYQTSVPSVSYVVAINVWMLCCIAFVFCSLLEYAIVIAFMNKAKSAVNPFSKKATSPDMYCAPSGEGNASKENNISSPTQSVKTSKSQPSCYTNIDRVSRIVFPLFFFVYSLIYWFMFST